MSQGRSLCVFLSLQALDLFTSALGFRIGAREGNAIAAQLFHLETVRGLLIAKGVAVTLALLIIACDHPRVIRISNFWFAGLITWNLTALWLQFLSVVWHVAYPARLAVCSSFLGFWSLWFVRMASKALEDVD